jgi:hypothetical protein
MVSTGENSFSILGFPGWKRFHMNPSRGGISIPSPFQGSRTTLHGIELKSSHGEIRWFFDIKFTIWDPIP